jgi:hypothetical protein
MKAQHMHNPQFDFVIKFTRMGAEVKLLTLAVRVLNV